VKILVFGRIGQLGSALAEVLSDRYETRFIDQPELDLTVPESVRDHVQTYLPSIVINAAAYTAVDRAETEPELAHIINARAPESLAYACDEAGAVLIHYSTDYVFDGTASMPYTETAAVAPTGVYGQSKLAGEIAVASATQRYVILRTAWLYSAVGNNFVKTMLKLANSGQPVRVVADQIGSPTYAQDLARVTRSIIEVLNSSREDCFGLYHVTNSGTTSWHGLAQEIFRLAAHQDVVVQPISTEEYPTPAPRPAYTALDCSKLERVFGLTLPSWRDALARCIDSL
jgi:dTDP-4-dehydrorhamnose reductase